MTTKPTRDSVTQLFTSFAGQAKTLVIPRPYIDFCRGDILAALLLSQILYWSERTDEESGWFAKSYEDWQAEIGMTEYQIKRAIKGDKRRKNDGFSLSAVGVETELRQSKFYNGAATVHYRVNNDKLRAAVLAFLGVLNIVQNEGKADPNIVQNAIPTLSRTGPEQCSERSTETTTEITSENKNIADPPDGGQQATEPASEESPAEEPSTEPTPTVEANPPTPVKRLFPSDEDKQDHVALIDAFHQALIDVGREPMIDNWYARYGRAAKPFVNQGVGPQAMYDSTCAVYHEAFPDSFYRRRAQSITLDEMAKVWATAQQHAESLKPPPPRKLVVPARDNKAVYRRVMEIAAEAAARGEAG